MMLMSAVGAVALVCVTPARAEKIEDNSFLIEEAYNQEPGIIQHIFTWQKKPQGAWDATFTEEVPVVSQKHQLSVTIPWTRTADPTSSTGLGDVLLNYRYQWLAGEVAAVAPRLSAVFPSGDWKKGLGSGATGVQFNLPISVSIDEHWVVHANTGWTYLPDAKNTAGQTAKTTSANFGASLIHLMTETFNPMLELSGSARESTTADSTVERTMSLTVSPGFRYAINAKSLQIVLGAAAPFETVPGTGAGLFLYASFEHPTGGQ